MANLVILNKMGLVNSTELGSYSNLNDCSIDNEDIRSQICLYQLINQKKDFQQLCIDILKNDEKTVLNDLEQKVSKVKNGDTPYSIMLVGQFGSDQAGFCHEIVGYAVEYASENNVFTGKNGKTYPSRILTYDSNAVTFKENYCILFDSSTGEWEIPGYNANEENMIIGAYFNNMEIAQPNDSDKDTDLDPIIYLDDPYLNGNALTLYRNHKSLGTYESLFSEAERRYLYFPNGVSTTARLAWICDEEGEYTFASDTGEGEKISFSYRGNDKYFSLLKLDTTH